MALLLALDQSSRVNGWAVFEDGSLHDCGKFELTGDVGERLVDFRQEVLDLIIEYEVDSVAFEDIQLQGNVANNVTTFKTLAMIFGVLTELCEEKNIPYEVVHSQTWKSTLGIKGRTRPEQKKASQAYVLSTYQVKASQDTCDAICIGATASKNSNGFDWS